MTGEVTLHGDVLPIGGLNEKAMAALRAGISTVLLPRDNAKDLDEMHEAIRGRLEFRFVARMDEVLAEVLLPKGRTTLPAARPPARPAPRRAARPAGRGGRPARA